MREDSLETEKQNEIQSEVCAENKYESRYIWGAHTETFFSNRL